MKAALSAIGLGALIATAFNVASAAPTATTTQTGIGNTAYTEQYLVDPTAPASATIVQVGNNNYAGDPVLQVPGILQRNINAYSAATALIYQTGNENAAAIVQDGTSFPVDATIQQMGDRNLATLTQNRHLEPGHDHTDRHGQRCRALPGWRRHVLQGNPGGRGKQHVSEAERRQPRRCATDAVRRAECDRA